MVHMMPAPPDVTASLWPEGDDAWCVDARRTLETIIADLLIDPAPLPAVRHGLDQVHDASSVRAWRDEISTQWWSRNTQGEVLSVRVLHRESRWAPRTELDDEPEALSKIGVLLQVLEYIAAGLGTGQTLRVK